MCSFLDLVTDAFVRYSGAMSEKHLESWIWSSGEGFQVET